MPGRFAFPRNERLSRKSDFERVFRTGERHGGRFFALHMVRLEGQGRKFGCAVPRAVGKAHVRNRVKRYLREVYRTHRPQLPEDVHFVLVARPAAAELDFLSTRDAVRALFRRGGLLDG